MTLPTQTWRVSPKYNITVAATMTIPELFDGIKAMLDTEDGLGNNYWTYCYSNTGSSRQMMFKRKGSPGGTLGTFRAGIFGGAAAVHASNLHFNVASNANTLFSCSSEDHNSDTPTNTYDAGAFLSGKYNPGVRGLATLTNYTSAAAVKVFMVECDRMCSIWVVTSATNQAGFHFTFGEIVERASDGVGLWGHFSTIDTLSGTEGGYEGATAASAFKAIDNATNQVGGGIYDTSATKGLGRVQFLPLGSTAADAFQNQANDVAVIMPIIAGSKAAAGATAVYTLGLLRQMRYSIRHTGQLALRDASNNVKGYLINAGFSATGRGLFYDQSP